MEDIEVFDADIPEEAHQFKGPTVVGGLFNAECIDGAASYFAGYVALKVNRFHSNKLKKSLNDCLDCENILVSSD